MPICFVSFNVLICASEGSWPSLMNFARITLTQSKLLTELIDLCSRWSFIQPMYADVSSYNEFWDAVIKKWVLVIYFRNLSKFPATHPNLDQIKFANVREIIPKPGGKTFLTRLSNHLYLIFSKHWAIKYHE